MKSLPPDANTLRIIESMCRKSHLRANPPEIEMANKWIPFTVTEPITLSKYGDAGAWEFIADCLRDGIVPRHKPPSAMHDDNAYEFVACPQDGGRPIYVKVAFVPNVRKIIGVSFHYERHP